MSTSPEAAVSADPILDLIGSVADEFVDKQDQPGSLSVGGAPIGKAEPLVKHTEPATPDTVPSGPTGAAAPPTGAHEAEPPTPDIPDFNPALPDELADYLDDDPLDLNLDDEPAPTARYAGEEDAEVYEDEELARLRRENDKLRKKAAHEAKLRADASRKGWEAEARKYFPLADLASIDAMSKRAFLRAARDSHQKIHAVVKPVLDQVKEEAVAIKQEARQAGKEEAVAAWGKPMAGPAGEAPSDPTPAQRQIENAPNLKSWIRAHFDDANMFEGR